MTATMEAPVMFPASAKQVSFITSLLADRVVDDEHHHYLMSMIEAKALSKGLASEEINSLLSKPKKVKEKSPKDYVEATPGYYTDGTNFFEVVASKQGRKYAKKLFVKMPQCPGHESLAGEHMGQSVFCDGSCRPKKVKASWDYAPGAMKDFQNWSPLTLEQAAEFGKKFGHCCMCGRLLTNPASIEAGIGPICADKF